MSRYNNPNMDPATNFQDTGVPLSPRDYYTNLDPNQLVTSQLSTLNLNAVRGTVPLNNVQDYASLSQVAYNQPQLSHVQTHAGQVQGHLAPGQGHALPTGTPLGMQGYATAQGGTILPPNSLPLQNASFVQPLAPRQVADYYAIGQHNISPTNPSSFQQPFSPVQKQHEEQQLLLSQQQQLLQQHIEQGVSSPRHPNTAGQYRAPLSPQQLKQLQQLQQLQLLQQLHPPLQNGQRFTSPALDLVDGVIRGNNYPAQGQGQEQPSGQRGVVQHEPLQAVSGNHSDLHHNTLPHSLPTTLNASLQIKSPTSPTQLSMQSPTIQNHSATMSPQSGLVRATWEAAKSETQEDQATSGRGSSISSSMSPTGSSPTSPNLGRADLQVMDYVLPIYELPAQKDLCLRCGHKVYAMERVGPIKDALYHKLCFTCVACGTKLQLNTFYHNPIDTDDLNVYCIAHKPRDRTVSAFDASAVPIKSALSAPRLNRVNEQIRGERSSGDILSRSPRPVVNNAITPREDVFYGMTAYEVQSELERQKQQQQQQVKNIQPACEAGYIGSGNSQALATSPSLQTGPRTTTTQSAQAGSTSSTCAGESVSNSSRPSPVSSVSSSSSSTPALTRRDRPSTESMENAVTGSQISESSVSGRIPSTDAIRTDMATQTQTPGQERGGNRRSNSSSRSTSPIQFQARCSGASSSPTFSRQSSTTSGDISFRDSLDGSKIGRTSSSGSRPGFWKQDSLERADRPSSLSNSFAESDAVFAEPTPTSVKKPASARMMVKSHSSNDVVRTNLVDKSRVLTRNESMRLDRPSQYP